MNVRNTEECVLIEEKLESRNSKRKVKINKIYEKSEVTVPLPRRNCKPIKAWASSVSLLSFIDTIAGFCSRGEEESDPGEAMLPVEGKGKETCLWGRGPSADSAQGTELGGLLQVLFSFSQMKRMNFICRVT